eukprot:CAMPEP_0181133622 /NCGR_PEP_ID=MMETSP1071-20121207/31625_1 /TAXON_ID=35127 /ORGANISM="Thalassiosira sp., Strain NH16" /LENGTH=345 /DNA_ID=CAMNT_0023220031 /DNA_START=298 /DNA_END=1335 /DNA_ORIENTATION=-
MGCFGCIIKSFLCTAVLASAAVIAWRFGPWYDDGSPDAPPDLQALNACTGCCNGLRSNCDLPVNEATFAMVHNAHSSKEDLLLEGALVAGYRGLMLDSCICDGSLGEKVNNFLKGQETGENYLGFCHVSCDAGVRDPTKVFANIKTFLEVNPNEVLIIEFEVRDSSLSQLHAAIDDSGLDDHIYRSTSDDSQSWPTLQELIDADTRLLLFAHGDGMKSCSQIRCPEGIFYTFDHFQETEWDDVRTCRLNGENNEVWAKGDGFFLMNHWKNNEKTELPSKSNAEEINTFEELTYRFGECEGRVPNVVSVDFWGVGDVLEFVREANLRNAGFSEEALAEARSQSQGD